jgi:hypothetical protein
VRNLLTGSQSPREQRGLFCFEQMSRARSCKDAKSKKAKQQELLRRALGTTNAKRMRPKVAIRFAALTIF